MRMEKWRVCQRVLKHNPSYKFYWDIGMKAINIDDLLNPTTEYESTIIELSIKYKLDTDVVASILIDYEIMNQKYEESY